MIFKIFKFLHDLFGGGMSDADWLNIPYGDMPQQPPQPEPQALPLTEKQVQDISDKVLFHSESLFHLGLLGDIALLMSQSRIALATPSASAVPEMLKETLLRELGDCLNDGSWHGIQAKKNGITETFDYLLENGYLSRPVQMLPDAEKDYPITASKSALNRGAGLSWDDNTDTITMTPNSFVLCIRAALAGRG